MFKNIDRVIISYDWFVKNVSLLSCFMMRVIKKIYIFFCQYFFGSKWVKCDMVKRFEFSTVRELFGFSYRTETHCTLRYYFLNYPIISYLKRS